MGQVVATRESDTTVLSRSRCENGQQRTVLKLLAAINRIRELTLLPTTV